MNDPNFEYKTLKKKELKKISESGGFFKFERTITVDKQILSI